MRSLSLTLFTVDRHISFHLLFPIWLLLFLLNVTMWIMYCWVSGLIHSAHQSLSGIWLPSFLHSVCSSDNCVGLGHDSMDVHCPFLASDGSWVDKRSLNASPSKPWWRDRRPSAWCLSLLTVICLRPLCSGCSEGCDLSRWAHNQCKWHACWPAVRWAVVDNGFIPVLGPPYKPRSPTTPSNAPSTKAIHKKDRTQ